MRASSSAFSLLSPPCVPAFLLVPDVSGVSNPPGVQAGPARLPRCATTWRRCDRTAGRVRPLPRSGHPLVEGVAGGEGLVC